ncbi:MAG: ubiquinol-cytochrome c reductase iron-sulfur subunit [Actinomycetota bacterium]
MSGEKRDDCFACKKKNARWREDFPVNWENDNYITRREMVKYLALGSLTIAGANFLLAGIPRLLASPPLPRTRVALASSLAPGSSILFRYPTSEDPCILVRQPGGGLVAYSSVCTHLSCAVVYEQKQNTLFCPCHNGFFSLPEGRPYAGPPTRPLPRIKLEQQGDELYAVGVEV